MIQRDAAARIAHLVDRHVSTGELRAALERPLTAEEREDIRALSQWFCRRYPTPLERLAYVRQAYRRWQQASGSAQPPTEDKR